jgi:hypothetical protein
MSVLSEPQSYTESAAYAFVEAHVWANGRVCPHCGAFNQSGPLKGKSNSAGRLQLQGLPPAVLGDGRHCHRAVAYPALQMGACLAASGVQQEVHVGASIGSR